MLDRVPFILEREREVARPRALLVTEPTEVEGPLAYSTGVVVDVKNLVGMVVLEI